MCTIQHSQLHHLEFSDVICKHSTGDVPIRTASGKVILDYPLTELFCFNCSVISKSNLKPSFLFCVGCGSRCDPINHCRWKRYVIRYPCGKLFVSPSSKINDCVSYHCLAPNFCTINF